MGPSGASSSVRDVGSGILTIDRSETWAPQVHASLKGTGFADS